MIQRLSPFTVVTAAALITALSPRIAAPQKPDLGGAWTGSLVEPGGRTDLMIEFFPNGKYARRVSTTTEFGWTLNGDILALAPAVRNGDDVSYGKATEIRIDLKDSVLVISDSHQSISLKRVTVPINESGLLGRWEGVSQANEGIVQDFLSDGRLIITVTLAREAGRYSIDKSNIRWEEQIPEPKRKKSRFRIDGEKLILYFTQDLPAIEMSRVPSSNASL